MSGSVRLWRGFVAYPGKSRPARLQDELRAFLAWLPVS
jgi:hypothetical protein